MVLFLNCCYTKQLFQPLWVIFHARFRINIILSKSCFFPDRTEWYTFYKNPDFSCSLGVKRVFYGAFVLKCTEMCKHRFRVQLLQNTPFCSSTFTNAKENLVWHHFISIRSGEYNKEAQRIVWMGLLFFFRIGNKVHFLWVDSSHVPNLAMNWKNLWKKTKLKLQESKRATTRRPYTNNKMESWRKKFRLDVSLLMF